MLSAFFLLSEKGIRAKILIRISLRFQEVSLVKEDIFLIIMYNDYGEVCYGTQMETK